MDRFIMLKKYADDPQFIPMGFLSLEAQKALKDETYTEKIRPTERVLDSLQDCSMKLKITKIPYTVENLNYFIFYN